MLLLGKALLFFALFAAIYQIVITGFAFRFEGLRRAQTLVSAHNAVRAVWVLLSLAFGVLFYQFLTNDFSNEYVFQHSARAQPAVYKISAAWGGQAGSLLMWAWVLSLYGVLVAASGRRLKQEIAPTVAAVISGVNVFFISMIAFAANPFAAAATVQPDGMGLNPLLQNYWMQIHPPTLYTGYVGCTVPFAFAVAALLHRRFDENWVSIVRRWALFAWIVLTIGIIMGGIWAYETLGWGGYWAWDPVENASFLPWLTLTAFIHSIMLQGRRGLLKNWNMILVTLTFLLSVFGTFLTRSGVVQSVHAFAQSSIGVFFVGFLIFAFIFSLGLMWLRRDELSSEKSVETLFSREGAFLLGNWLLLGLMFAILWGTVWPTFSKELLGHTISVEKPYFNRVMAPLGLALLFLAGVGPLLAWRRATLKGVWRAVQKPFMLALIALPIMWVVSRWSVPATIAFTLCVFVALAIGYEIWRGVKARRSIAGEAPLESLLNLYSKNRRRYGGYTVHLGLALFVIGITGSNVFKIELEPMQLKPGEELRIGEYTLVFKGFAQPQLLAPEKLSDVAAQMLVKRNGQVLKNRDGSDFSLYPNIDTYKNASAVSEAAMAGQEPQTARRPAIMSTAAHDLYLALIGYDLQANTATIKAYLNPLVMWIWISTLFFIGGTMISMWPDRKKAPSPVRSEAAQKAKSSAPSRSARPVATAASRSAN